jgi:lipopolysaccharide export system protein LptA
MTKKLTLWIAVAVFSTVAWAATKSYNVVVSAPMKAGNAQLAPGDYKVKIEGSNAVFTDQHTRTSVTVPVKIENGTAKFNSTSIDTTKQGNTTQITSIELGGSTMKLDFGK